MDVLFPRTEQEMQAMMAECPRAEIMAGGTDLLAGIRKKPGARPEALICTERVEGWKTLSVVGEKLVVGPAVTLQSLLDSDIVKYRLPALHQAIAVLAAPPVRHAATLAGNICTASPAGDTLPPLYVLDAVVVARRSDGERRVPVRGWVAGPGKTDQAKGEYLAGVEIPMPPKDSLCGFLKVGHRRAMAIAVASLAYLIGNDTNSAVKARFAWGSVGPTVLELPAVERVVEEGGLGLANLRKAAEIAARSVSPIDDLRATAGYRRRVAGNLLLNLSNLP